MKEYIRDGRAPIPRSETTSKVMRANKPKDTEPELQMRKSLRTLGLTSYRLHWNKAPGRPDIAFPREKIAIFIHGCYWHRCPICNLPLPKTHKTFWKKKFDRNIERDRKKTVALKKDGWAVIVIWECQLKKNTIIYARKIKTLFDKKHQ